MSHAMIYDIQWEDKYDNNTHLLIRKIAYCKIMDFKMSGSHLILPNRSHQDNEK